MTRDERLETVEELSTTVTNDLGLREQLEVIRIINPLADLPTTDSEFYIGKKCLLVVIALNLGLFLVQKCIHNLCYIADQCDSTYTVMFHQDPSYLDLQLKHQCVLGLNEIYVWFLLHTNKI